MNKIYHNIEESEYSLETDLNIFWFSSLLYLNKFAERYMDHRKNLKFKLSSRYNIEFDANDYIDIILYNQIEKRGFKVLSKKDEVIHSCLSNIKLDGVIKTLEN